jgi:hypothetical protein
MSTQKEVAAALKSFHALVASVSDGALSEFTLAIAEICASIGDDFSDGKNDADDTAGNAIRAKFGVA